MSMITWDNDYPSNGKIKYAKINDDGALIVRTSPFIDSGAVHLYLPNVTTSSNYILVDLSDTVNYPHDNTDYTQLEHMRIGIDADNQADYEITVGYIKYQSATGGTFNHLYSFSGDKNVGQNTQEYIYFGEFGPKMKNGYVLSNDIVTSSVYGPNSQLRSTLDSSVANTYVGVGDIVVNIIRNAGSFNLTINMAYHSK